MSSLTDAETFVLLDLVRARQPDNAEYLMRINAVSWARLQACATQTPMQVQTAIDGACRTPEPAHV